jgi:lipopolysaccharide heptosyltransferase I
MKAWRNILIVRLSSLGDILHTLPAFHSLRTSFPAAKIGWLVERRLAFLLGAVDGIDEILAVDTHAFRHAPLRRDAWRRLWAPVAAARAQRYDVAIDFQGLLKTALLTAMTGARRRIGFPSALVRERPAHWLYHQTVLPPAVPMHVARLNLKLAEAAGAAPAALSAALRASEEDTRAVDERLVREQLSAFVVINPGGGWPTKRWPPARYGALAARIGVELQCGVVVATGPGEEALYEVIARNCEGQQPVHFQLPFLQLMPLFRRARLVVAGDTGPMHLACALGTPVVSIMGPTSPVRNGPWNERDEVVVRRLPCSFCNGRTCPTSNECMDITVDEVFAALVRRLEKEKGLE